MGNSYTRQSAANIVTGAIVQATPINAEFNQLQNAFDASAGHAHDGTLGNAPKISLTGAISGVLPIVNGGIGGINKTNAVVAPTVTNDVNSGYVTGSLWINIANNTVYICTDPTVGAAIWKTYQQYDNGLQSIANLTTTADTMIYTTAMDVYATTALTPFSRTVLATTTANGHLTSLGVSTYIQTLLDDVDAPTARSTLGLTIGTNVQAYDSTLTSLAAYNTNGIVTQTAGDTFVGRTITGTANEVTLTNGDGVAGNPTVSLPTALTFTGKTVTGGTFMSPTINTPTITTPTVTNGTFNTPTITGGSIAAMTGNIDLNGNKLLNPLLAASATPTKIISFDTSNITAGQTRNILVPDTNTALSKWEIIGDYSISSVGSLSQTNLSAFRKIRISGLVIPSAQSSLLLRTSTDNGVTYDSGGTDYTYQVSYSVLSSQNASGSQQGSMFLTPTATDAGSRVTFEFIVEGFNQTAILEMHGRTSFIVSSSLAIGLVAGQRNTTTARNALSILVSPGTMTGNITIEGIRG